MSFILDALRKSEHERQRNNAPGTVGMRARSTRQTRNLWLPAVALLIGVNLSLLVVLWIRSDSEPAPAQIEQPPPAPLRDFSETVPQQPRRLPVIAPGQTVAPPERTLADELPPAPAADLAAGSAAATAQTARPSSSIPTLTEVLLDGSVAIAPLHLDVHVYSQKPAERFVFINTDRYREGDKLKEGPSVSEITAEGVKLTYQGRSFLLTRD